MCGALKLSGIVRANVRLNIAIPLLFLPLIMGSCMVRLHAADRCRNGLAKEKKGRIHASREDSEFHVELRPELPSTGGSGPEISPQKVSERVFWGVGGKYPENGWRVAFQGLFLHFALRFPIFQFFCCAGFCRAKTCAFLKSHRLCRTEGLRKPKRAHHSRFSMVIKISEYTYF